MASEIGNRNLASDLSWQGGCDPVAAETVSDTERMAKLAKGAQGSYNRAVAALILSDPKLLKDLSEIGYTFPGAVSHRNVLPIALAFARAYENVKHRYAMTSGTVLYCVSSFQIINNSCEMGAVSERNLSSS